MRSNRKISDEARHDVAVIARPQSHQGNRHTRKKMGGGLGLHTRREVLVQMIPSYREASVAQKRQLLDDFTHLTGYHRRYAMWLLKHHTGQGQQPCVAGALTEICFRSRRDVGAGVGADQSCVANG